MCFCVCFKSASSCRLTAALSWLNIWSSGISLDYFKERVKSMKAAGEQTWTWGHDGHKYWGKTWTWIRLTSMSAYAQLWNMRLVSPLYHRKCRRQHLHNMRSLTYRNSLTVHAINGESADLLSAHGCLSLLQNRWNYAKCVIGWRVTVVERKKAPLLKDSSLFCLWPHSGHIPKCMEIPFTVWNINSMREFIICVN